MSQVGAYQILPPLTVPQSTALQVHAVHTPAACSPRWAWLGWGWLTHEDAVARPSFQRERQGVNSAEGKISQSLRFICILTNEDSPSKLIFEINNDNNSRGIKWNKKVPWEQNGVCVATQDLKTNGVKWPWWNKDAVIYSVLEKTTEYPLKLLTLPKFLILKKSLTATWT